MNTPSEKFTVWVLINIIKEHPNRQGVNLKIFASLYTIQHVSQDILPMKSQSLRKKCVLKIIPGEDSIPLTALLHRCCPLMTRSRLQQCFGWKREPQLERQPATVAYQWWLSVGVVAKHPQHKLQRGLRPGGQTRSVKPWVAHTLWVGRSCSFAKGHKPVVYAPPSIPSRRHWE